ncbi:MAG: DEAD/DEAH box helicase [Fibrobacterales bacterium]|nr:DEAD/DEAH box helicase [Fibrobacterales bacterium]
MNLTAPLIVQSDLEILVEVDNPNYVDARDDIAPFTELIKSPEHLHTYRISHLSLWNAASVGLDSDEVVARLEKWSKYPLPSAVVHEVRTYMDRYGALKLVARDGKVFLESEDPLLVEQAYRIAKAKPHFLGKPGGNALEVKPEARGLVKMELAKADYPVEDLVGYVEGEPLEIGLRGKQLLRGGDFSLRDYQREAAAVFWASGAARGGSGVVVLPCGAGKTIVGIVAMSLVKSKTLILVPNVTAARQWIDELVDKTTLTRDDVKEYSGERKEIGPVTVATYQINTRRTGFDKDGNPLYEHFEIFGKNRWGLIVYDEVHMLPAPVFSKSAQMQATRRLGLTATLVREDGRETDVFSLIGPKKFDLPWKTLEAQGWIASAVCREVRVPLDEPLKMVYSTAEGREQAAIAATNPAKEEVVRELLDKHSAPDDRVIVIGRLLAQLERISANLGLPLITGSTPEAKRKELYDRFRDGDLKRLVLSNVGNFALDLPDANVLIQISGTFGSRQEEAQRLGRVLRPKKGGGNAYFYTLVSRDTCEQKFAMNRQRFLAEQGYQYDVVDMDE